MSKGFGFDVPEDMVSFYKACLKIYASKLITKAVEDEITKETGIGRAQIQAINKWLEKLPDDIKADTLGSNRFDLFETIVMKMMLTDSITLGLKRIKEILPELKDANSISSVMGSMLNKWEMLSDTFMKHKHQSGRKSTVKTPDQKFEDATPDFIKIAK